MQMERVRLNHSSGYCHSNYNYKYSQFSNDHDETEEELDPLSRGRNDLQKSRFLMSPTNTYPFSSSSTSPSSPESIEHRVSRMDTLAGVAIKYGVEVADIKKFNGLVTDHQMFALKSLQIPLPGRHPPSSCLSNGHDTSRERVPSCRLHTDFFDSFQSLRPYSSQRKVSPAMSSLQGYYGLTDLKITEAFEIGEYGKGDYDYQEDVQYLKPSPASNTPLSSHRKSRSLVNVFSDENNGMADEQLSIDPRENDSEKWNEKLIRRRQKSEADFTSISHVTLMREDSCGSVSSAITGKSLALRSKASSRAVSPTYTEIGVLADTLMTGGFFSIRRSSSTSSLHDQGSSSSSIWAASKGRLKPDLLSLSAAAIARPIFDGLPKPITSRRNKTALD